MNAAARLFRHPLCLSLAGVVLLCGCHKSSSSGAATVTSTYSVVVNVVGLAGSGLVLQDNALDNLSVTSSGQFTFTTQIQNGATYSVTVLTQPASPAQVCSIPLPVGYILGANVTVEVSCGTTGTAVGRFAYVANRGSGTVSAYSINATTGALTEIAGSPIEVPGARALYQTLIDPTGSFLYALDAAGDGIYAAQINQNTGALVKVSGSPFATGRSPLSLAFDYSGAYLYVANYADSTISAYALSTSTGALTPLSGSPFAVPGTGAGPVQIVTSGEYLFSANMNAGSIAVFGIVSGTGLLTQGVNGSPFATDVRPRSIAIDATGKVLYTANAGAGGTGSISGYTVDLSSGVLSPVAGSPFAIPVSYNIGIDAQSRYLFVTEAAGIAVYPIVNTATGLLDAPVAGSPFAAGTTPFSVAIDLVDEFAYVANDGSANVSQYTFNATTGVLTPVAGSPVGAGQSPDYIQIQ